jgi:hypothetical protein
MLINLGYSDPICRRETLEIAHRLSLFSLSSSRQWAFLSSTPPDRDRLSMLIGREMANENCSDAASRPFQVPSVQTRRHTCVSLKNANSLMSYKCKSTRSPSCCVTAQESQFPVAGIIIELISLQMSSQRVCSLLYERSPMFECLIAGYYLVVEVESFFSVFSC